MGGLGGCGSGGSGGRAEALGGGWGRGRGPLPVVYRGLRAGRGSGLCRPGLGGERPADVPEVGLERGFPPWEAVLDHGEVPDGHGVGPLSGRPLRVFLWKGGMGDCRRRPVGGRGG